MPDTTLPEPFYYLKNFSTALNWVLARYADVLSPEEYARGEAFLALPQPCQALLVRLFSRKGEHFRLSKLAYAEIGELTAPIATLCQEGWLLEDAPLTLSELADLLLKAEISAHLPPTGLSNSAKKIELIEALSLQELPAKPFSQWCPHLPERLISVATGAWADLIRLLFFGNLAQQWSEFVLADLGVYRYEKVAFSQDSRGFQARADVDDYLALRALRERFYQGEAADAVLPQILAFSPHNPLLQRRQQHLFAAIAKAYEQAGDLDSALALYQRCNSAEARWRQVRILEHKALYLEAHQHAQRFAQAPVNDEESQRLERARARLGKKLKLPAAAKSAFYESREELVLEYAGSVELAVRNYLHSEQRPVYYVENALFSSLFGLVCWEAIFAPLPGAFFHPFHTGPVDLYSEDFVSKRHALFDACLARLDDGSYRQLIGARIKEKFGIQSPFVFWGALEPTLLELALNCIAPNTLKAIFQRFLQDLKANRTGMPDLIQFDPAQHSFRLIEVKGPGDRLQDNQKRWLSFAQAHGIEVAVCYVRWSADAL